MWKRSPRDLADDVEIEIVDDAIENCAEAFEGSPYELPVAFPLADHDSMSGY